MTTIPPAVLAGQHIAALRAGLAYLPEAQRELPPDLTDSIRVAEAIAALPRAALGGNLERRLGTEIAASATAATLDAAIDQAAAQAWRQQVINQMRGPMTASSAERTLAAVRAAAAILRKRALPVFASHVKGLTEAARKLPSPDPLDARAVIQTDSARPYTDARTHVQAIVALGGLVSVVAPRHVTPSAGPIVAVVDPGAIEMELKHPTHESALNTPAALAHIQVVRALLESADKDITATLIRVARGEFPGVALSLAEPGEAMTVRAEAFSRAQVQRRAYEVHRGQAVVA